MKSQDGKIVNELKIKGQADSVLKFLKGTNVTILLITDVCMKTFCNNAF
jgi:hypothetical protein